MSGDEPESGGGRREYGRMASRISPRAQGVIRTGCDISNWEKTWYLNFVGGLLGSKRVQEAPTFGRKTRKGIE
ncbi:hypothetical protein R1flu_001860 [Riccia fluitans]|uniref:Uncharacterized protein n=1 Tax=Riccia fluitans TaxID=41844 RepID=A0ABD1Y4M8_9MARC